MVSVGPRLFCKEPSLGSVLFRSPTSLSCARTASPVWLQISSACIRPCDDRASPLQRPVAGAPHSSLALK